MFTQVREVSYQQCLCKNILHWANVCFSAHAVSQPCRHTTQPVKRYERAMQCIYDIKFGMLQVGKNEISLRKCSGCSAQLLTSERTLVIGGGTGGPHGPRPPTFISRRAPPFLNTEFFLNKIK